MIDEYSVRLEVSGLDLDPDSLRTASIRHRCPQYNTFRTRSVPITASRLHNVQQLSRQLQIATEDTSQLLNVAARGEADAMRSSSDDILQ